MPGTILVPPAAAISQLTPVTPGRPAISGQSGRSRPAWRPPGRSRGDRPSASAASQQITFTRSPAVSPSALTASRSERKSARTVKSKPGSSSSRPSRNFQSIRARTWSAACRSDSPSAYCGTDTSASAPGQTAGRPRPGRPQRSLRPRTAARVLPGSGWPGCCWGTRPAPPEPSAPAPRHPIAVPRTSRPTLPPAIRHSGRPTMKICPENEFTNGVLRGRRHAAGSTDTQTSRRPLRRCAGFQLRYATACRQELLTVALPTALLQLDFPVGHMIRRPACSAGLKRPGTVRRRDRSLSGRRVRRLGAGRLPVFAGGDGLAVASAVGASSGRLPPYRWTSRTPVNLVSRSRIRKPKEPVRSPRSMITLRTCWAVQEPSGWVVTPRTSPGPLSRCPLMFKWGQSTEASQSCSTLATCTVAHDLATSGSREMSASRMARCSASLRSVPPPWTTLRQSLARVAGPDSESSSEHSAEFPEWAEIRRWNSRSGRPARPRRDAARGGRAARAAPAPSRR